MNIWQIGRAALHSLQSLNVGDRKSKPGKRRRLLLEPLEHRALLTVSVNTITGPETGTTAPAGDFAVPSGKDLYVPVTGTSATTQGITYTANSNTAGVTATVITGDLLQFTVSGTSSSGTPFSGTLTFELFSSIAPTTVADIEADVAAGTYNGAEFYRSETNASFQLIQGGIKPPSGTIAGHSAATGAGNPPDEFNAAATFNSSGMLAMANAGAGTASTEFFVTAPNTTLSKEPQSLDGGYTIF